MSTYLPEDAVIEILSRLPVQSLIRFRCVCKSWYSLIRNPSFISKHLSNNNNNNNSNSNSNARLLVTHCPFITQNPLLSLLYSSTQNEGLYDDAGALSLDMLDIPFYKEKHHSPFVLGPCNGIFCLYSDPIVLLNPSIREFKAISLSPFPHPPSTTPLHEVPGFGLDPKTNDYKLVVIISLLEEYEGGGVILEPPLVEVYDLSTDSWRRIDALDAIVMTFVGLYYWTNKYLNGVCYWWIDDRGDPAILSFDMGDEVFCKTSLPVPFSREETGGTLALFDESLAYVLYNLQGNDRCFDIWVMDKYGAEASWSKQLTIGPFWGVERPLGFWKNGALILENSSGELVLYDPDAQLIKNLQVHGMKDSLHIAIYAESLVSVMGGNEIQQQGHSFDIVPHPFFYHKPCSGLNQIDPKPSCVENCLKFLFYLKSLFSAKYFLADIILGVLVGIGLVILVQPGKRD